MAESNSSLRVLQCGVGRWGANHLRVWRQLGVELFVADPFVATHDAVRKAGVAADHIVTNFEDALDRVDLVDIVTPVDSHYPIAMTAIEARKDVFVEKPLTATSLQGIELDRRAEQLGQILQVGHIQRYDTAIDFVKTAIDCGDLGAVRWIQARFAGFKRPRADCGVTAADSLHFIDTFNYLLGATPDAVLACMADILGRGRGMEDASWMALEYATAAGSALATVEANYFTPPKERTLVVAGEKATIVCDLGAKTDRVKAYHNEHVAKNGVWTADEGAVTVPELLAAEPLARELAAFVESHRTRRPPLADGRCGWEVVRIIEAAQESAATGQAVSLGPAVQSTIETATDHSIERSSDANRAVVAGVHIRRDQAESHRNHRLRAIHPRAELHRV